MSCYAHIIIDNTIKSIIMNIYPVHCETRSTSITNDHHRFYSHIEDLYLYITEQQPTITWSSPLFQKVTNLTVKIPMISSSLWHKLFNVGKKNIFNLIYLNKSFQIDNFDSFR